MTCTAPRLSPCKPMLVRRSGNTPPASNLLIEVSKTLLVGDVPLTAVSKPLHDAIAGSGV